MPKESATGEVAPFFQEGPELQNTFESDDLLRSFLRWRLPKEILVEIEPGLSNFGQRMVGDVQLLALAAEAQPPRHIPFDAWGRRIDDIQVSDAWPKLHRVSAEEGLIAIGYERAHGAYSRIHQFAKLYLFHPSSAFYSCPLAMTDGAARVLELFGTPEMKGRAFKNLTSRNPERFWTSGQWMTERTGGSDVSGTTTFAHFENGQYKLRGDKWFTSATTSQMTMALAKTVGGPTGASGALSLFYLELRDERGQLQNIEIHRLKDKLGTRALPTAELSLRGTPGTLVGLEGEGVKRISSLLNITRLYNSTCAIGTMSRTLQLAKDYASKRHVFGKLLSAQPLHVQTLADLQTEFEGMFHVVFHLVQLLGKDEVQTATSEESMLLRLLTPIAKLMTAKASIAHVSEVIESFGGAGYIEETGLPKHLRDAQVFSIWEGTTNVLSLDVLRAIGKDGMKSKVLEVFFTDVERRVADASGSGFEEARVRIGEALQKLRVYLLEAQSLTNEQIQAGARDLALSLGRVFAASLMLEFASWCQARQRRPNAGEILRRFCCSQRPLVQLRALADLQVAQNERLVFG
jgi:putative acyl-CoA dehydrogenase